MATEFTRYIIELVGQTKGVQQVQAQAKTLDTSIKSLGVDLSKATRIIGTDFTTALNRKGQVMRRAVVTWEDQNKQIHKTNLTLGKAVRATKDVTGTFVRADAPTKTMAQNFQRLAYRAALTIPIWLALRAVVMSFIRFISNTIRTWSDLEREMGRVAGVTRGTTDDLNMLKDAVIDFSRNSSRGFKEAASAMYALGSAGLTVTQQLVGMEHIMNVAIGTFGDTEQIAKLMAGAFNVFGKSLKDVTTDSQKFKKIADILAYTYSTQQVELSEIATAMTYVASVGKLLNIEFEALVGTIGVLNTGMLKGSKSGTALMNAFVRLAQKGEALAKLGVVFDPSQPLDFLDVMTQLHKKYGEQALSLNALKELMQVFGRRGGRAAAQLIHDYDRWTQSLENAHKNFNDFAEEMREKAEDTLPMATAKLGNAIKADLIDRLKQIAPAAKEAFAGLADEIEAATLLRRKERIFPTAPKTPAERAMKIAAQPLLPPGFEMISKLFDLSKKMQSGEVERIKANKIIIDLYEKQFTAKEKIEQSSKDVASVEDKLNILAQQLKEGKIDEIELWKKLAALVSDSVKEMGGLTALNRLNNEQLASMVTKLREMITLQEEAAKTTAKITQEEREKFDKIRDSAKYEFLRIRGVTNTRVEHEKLKDLIDKVNEKIQRNNQARQEALAAGKETNLVEINTLNTQDLIAGKVDDMEQAFIHIAGVKKDILAIDKQRLEVNNAIVKEIQKSSEELRTAFKDVFKDVLMGEAEFADIGRRMSEAIREGFAESISESFSRLLMTSGIGDVFGQMNINLANIFGGAETKFETAIFSGSLRGSALFEQAIIRGSQMGQMGGKGRQVATAMGKPVYESDVKPAQPGLLQRGLGYGMAGLMGGLAGYQAGASTGRKGLGVLGGVMGGAGGIMSMIPGMQGFGAALMMGSQLLGMFKKEKRTEERTQTFAVTSRIDVTNKQLQIVNRNLVALRMELTYILPESAYFAEKRGTLEDEFSLFGRR